jgi:chemotaxis protein methyltransferase CheR
LAPNPASQNVSPGPEAAKAWEHYEQARLDAARGRGSQAATVLEQLFDDPRFSSLPAQQQARALYLMARIQADQGRLEQAAQWGAKAFSADKTHPATLHLLTMIHQELGQDQEAKTALKRLLYLQPDCIAAHAGLGSVAMRGNKRAEARRHFHNALHLLSALPSSALVPEMDDLPAGRVAENLRAMMAKDNL